MPLTSLSDANRSLLLIHADDPQQANQLAVLGSHYGHRTRILDRHGMLVEGEAADGLLVSCRRLSTETRIVLSHRPALAKVLFCSRLSVADHEILLAKGVWLVPHRCSEQERIESWLTLARKLQMILKDGEQREQALLQQLEDRRWVERAKGQLMQQHGLSEEAAYGLLRKTAMDHGKSLGVLARQLLQLQVR
ncbi:TPA: ANTAR domain-containing response regulator [Aeromonas veronii]